MRRISRERTSSSFVLAFLCMLIVVSFGAPALATVLWFSACDSHAGWTVPTTPPTIATLTVHTPPGAWMWNTSQDQIYATWTDTPPGSAIAMRFWFNDAETSSQGGNAPCIEFRKADRSTANVAGFCLYNYPGYQLSKYQFRCLGDTGGTKHYNGTVNRIAGWRRVEMYYPGGANAFTWTVDGTVHYTRTPSAPLSFGSVIVGYGIGTDACIPAFRVDTMAVMDAPRKLMFLTSQGTGGIEVSITTPSGLQTGTLAANHVDGCYDSTEQLTLVAPTIDDYAFSDWTSTCGGAFGTPNAATTTYTAATGDGTITANYRGSACSPPSGTMHVSKISDIWALANDATVCNLTGKKVTAMWSDGFWIEETDRSAGIKIMYDAGNDCTVGGAIAAGSSVDVYGTLSTGDVRLMTASVVVNHGAGTALKPVMVAEKYSGGKQPNGATPAVTGGKGIYGVGLLVRIAGYLSKNGSDYYLDDGSGLLAGTIHGMKMISLTTPPTGNKVVTGVIGIIAGKPVIYAISMQ